MTKRKHRNKLTRLTAKERATAYLADRSQWENMPKAERVRGLEKVLQAHARDAVARYKLRHCCDCDIRNAAR